MCLYPEIKDNIYIKSYNKGKTQPMLRVTAASLSGVTPGVTVQFCYSRMHSFHHSFMYLLKDSSMPETSIIIFCHYYLCLGLFWNLPFLKPYYHFIKNVGSEYAVSNTCMWPDLIWNSGTRHYFLRKVYTEGKHQSSLLSFPTNSPSSPVSLRKWFI